MKIKSHPSIAWGVKWGREERSRRDYSDLSGGWSSSKRGARIKFQYGKSEGFVGKAIVIK